MDAFLDLESRAEIAPESPAILAPGRPPLSYSALWRRVTAIRRQLAGAGLVPGHPLALVFPDGPDFIVTLLAATGLGSCAPLDPAASQEEYQFFLSHLRAPALVMLEGCSSAAVASAEAQGMSIVRVRYLPDYELASVAGSPGNHRLWTPRLTPASLLLFTSSTTGRPKLVPVTSDNLEITSRNEARALDLSSRDRLLNLTPLCNPRGVRAALTQLCQGGSVVCAPRFDPNCFPKWLVEFQPTWISVAAAGLGVLCSQARQIPGLWRDTGVRFIRSGGTAPEPQLMRDFEALSGVPVLDGYGTTESGGVTRVTIGCRRPGSVGRSTGATIAILDDAGKVLGPEMPGEIVIRGPSVMSGYLDDDEANGRAFLDGWFRTGDLGHLDGDGFLFLTGRTAEVINRGGQKVLPQQVEAVLKDHPAVQEAAVFGVAHKTLGEEVAAAVVLTSQPVSELDLRRFAAARLAAYKVPHRILFVDRLPRNTAGKLQRKLLSGQYEQLANRERQAVEAPSTETEKSLAAMWEEEFRNGPIGREADFFRLGGDSLTAAVVATRIRATFGVSLDLRAFAEYPKLKDLSSVVDELRQGRREQLQTLECAPRNGPFPLSSAQERTWKYAFPTPAVDGYCPLNYNMAFAHLLRGPLDPEMLRRSMMHLVAHHEILRTTFEQSGGRPVQVVHSSADCEVPMLDVSNLPEPAQQASLVLQEEAGKPFHLARGPLVRFVLVRLGPEEHWLIRVNHHLISDGHSWRIYFRELGQVYDDLLHGRAPQPLDLQQAGYGDYALWQRRELSPARPACREAIEWWAARFSRLPRLLMLPFHESVNRATSSRRRDGEPVSASQGVLSWGLDPAVSVRLNQLQGAEGVSFYETRLAAFAALLGDMTGQPEVIIGSHFSFRNRLEWQNIMGDFTNFITLLLTSEGTLTFRESVRAAHQQVTETSAHGEVPYELLDEELRARGVTPPEIGVMFYSADHTAPAQFGDVEMTWLDRAVPVMPWGFQMFVDKHNEDRLCLVLFDAVLYDPEAVRAFVARFVRLLDAASRHPDLTLDRLLAASR